MIRASRGPQPGHRQASGGESRHRAARPASTTPAGLRDALASTGFALIAAAVLGTVITAGVAPDLPYTAAAMMAGVASGGGMPPIPAASSRSRFPPPASSWRR